MTDWYAKQLDDIGRILVQARVLTAADVRRHGVRFAIRERFQSPKTAHPKRKI